MKRAMAMLAALSLLMAPAPALATPESGSSNGPTPEQRSRAQPAASALETRLRDRLAEIDRLALSIRMASIEAQLNIGRKLDDLQQARAAIERQLRQLQLGRGNAGPSSQRAR